MLDREGLEAALPDVAAGMVVPMVATHMGIRQPMHPAAKVAFLMRPQHEMEVVGHQTPREGHRHRVLRRWRAPWPSETPDNRRA